MVGQTSIIIGCYWLLISLALDISRDLFRIDATEIDRLQLKRDLINYIQLKSDAKRLSEYLFRELQHIFNEEFLVFFRIIANFLKAYEFNITAHFLWSTLVICGDLLQFQIELV